TYTLVHFSTGGNGSTCDQLRCRGSIYPQLHAGQLLKGEELGVVHVRRPSPKNSTSPAKTIICYHSASTIASIVWRCGLLRESPAMRDFGLAGSLTRTPAALLGMNPNLLGSVRPSTPTATLPRRGEGEDRPDSPDSRAEKR